MNLSSQMLGAAVATSLWLACLLNVPIISGLIWLFAEQLIKEYINGPVLANQLGWRTTEQAVYTHHLSTADSSS